VTLLPNSCPALPSCACPWVNFGLKKMTVLSQSPHQQDVAPCEFFLFLKLRIAVKGTSINDNKKNCRTSCKVSNIARHQVIWTAARWMGLLCNIQRRLHGADNIDWTCCCYGEIGSIPKMFGCTALRSDLFSLLFLSFLSISYTYLHENY
jgi:hypothetical protein